MMWAVYENDTILNVILADSKEIAELVTGLNAVEVVNYAPEIGWVLINGEWVAPTAPSGEGE